VLSGLVMAARTTHGVLSWVATADRTTQGTLNGFFTAARTTQGVDIGFVTAALTTQGVEIGWVMVLRSAQGTESGRVMVFRSTQGTDIGCVTLDRTTQGVFILDVTEVVPLVATALMANTTCSRSGVELLPPTVVVDTGVADVAMMLMAWTTVRYPVSVPVVIAWKMSASSTQGAVGEDDIDVVMVDVIVLPRAPMITRSLPAPPVRPVRVGQVSAVGVDPMPETYADPAGNSMTQIISS
jgi:hypothetical protein